MRLPPIVNAETFEKAQQITAERARRYTDAELRTALDALLKSEGRLSLAVLRKKSIPCPEVYQKHFGGLLEAYAAIGYVPAGNFSYLEDTRRLNRIRALLFVGLENDLIAAGATVRRQKGGRLLRVNDEFTLRFKVARCYGSAGTCKWLMLLTRRSDADMTVVARMEPGNEVVLDYYIVQRKVHLS